MGGYSNLQEMVCNVLVIDRQAITRYGIKAILEQKNDVYIFRVTGAMNAVEAVQKVEGMKVDVALLDDTVYDGKGPQVTTRLLELRPDLRILGMSERPENWRVREMVDVGALGYIKKNVTPTELLQAVAGAFSGKRYYSAMVANSLLEENRSNYEKMKRSPDELSPRELDVLKLIALGKTSKEISGLLRIGVRTVETHRKHLIKKTNVSNAASLISLAYEYKLLP
jgi:DNA-binding NarL/FixJ family response regulator